MRFARGGANLAIEIYITDFKSIKPQSNFSQNNFLSNLAKPNLTPISPEIQGIKIKAFIFMGVCVAGNIICGFANLLIQSGRDSGVGLVFFGLLVIFGAYMTLYSTMESMWQKAKSAILRDNFNAYLATLFFIFLSSLVIVALINGERSDGKAVLVLLCLVVWIVCLIYNIYLRYQIYKEVAYITNQPLFVVAFWCGVTIILLPIAFIVYIIAWIGVREIRQSLSAGR